MKIGKLGDCDLDDLESQLNMYTDSGWLLEDIDLSKLIIWLYKL